MQQLLDFATKDAGNFLLVSIIGILTLGGIFRSITVMVRGYPTNGDIEKLKEEIEQLKNKQ